MTDKLFDIVIPLGKKDINLIYSQIKHTKKNILNYNKIYIITSLDIQIDDCEIISENIFPFSLETIKLFHGNSDRHNWYFQQLLKLYAGFIIPNIKDKYLVIDVDTFFLKPTSFIENNKCLYNYSFEYTIHYFNHSKRLLENNDFNRNHLNFSGICHHMIFETKFIKEIMDKIETKHNDKFYNIMLKLVNINNKDELFSGFSEYELYFNYMINNHLNEITIRHLNYKDIYSLNEQTINSILNYDYISIHTWFLDDPLNINLKKIVYKILDI